MRCGAVAVKIDKDQHSVAVKKKEIVKKNCSVRFGLDVISEPQQIEGCVMRDYAHCHLTFPAGSQASFPSRRRMEKNMVNKTRGVDNIDVSKRSM